MSKIKKVIYVTDLAQVKHQDLIQNHQTPRTPAYRYHTMPLHIHVHRDNSLWLGVSARCIFHIHLLLCHQRSKSMLNHSVDISTNHFSNLGPIKVQSKLGNVRSKLRYIICIMCPYNCHVKMMWSLRLMGKKITNNNNNKFNDTQFIQKKKVIRIC